MTLTSDAALHSLSRVALFLPWAQRPHSWCVGTHFLA
jgi:hypothetical protein